MEKFEEAFSLWLRLFDEIDSPFVASETDGMFFCFFCGAVNLEKHAKDCIWMAADELTKSSHAKEAGE